MTTPLESSIICILDENSHPVGVGFLINDKLALTCSHVIKKVLPNIDFLGEVSINFPLLSQKTPIVARVIHINEEIDIAGLELLSAKPKDAVPAHLVNASDLWGHPYRAYGFPNGYDDGVWTSGTILAHTRANWLQIDDAKNTGYEIQEGFSGGPIWDGDLKAVVGMVVAVDRHKHRSAYGLPIKEIASAWPGLSEQIIPTCPYRGLFAFREQDATLFFGREKFVDQLFSFVQSKRLVTVVGPSGSGKSSVVFSGLIPKLRRQGDWVIRDFRPGKQPFGALAASLLQLLEPRMTVTDRNIETTKLSLAIKNGNVDLQALVRQILEKCDRVSRILLVVDQFEELYVPSMTQEEWQDLLEERQRFIDVLLNALNGNNLTILFTVRADFMGQVLSYRPLADALQYSDLKLGPMNLDELRRSIEQPATIQQVMFEKGLVERILTGVSRGAGGLPLLEFALTLLWEHQSFGLLTHSAYDQIGQVDGALTQYAEQVFARLGPEEQNQARKIFIQLVTPGDGTDDIRRVATRTELGDKLWYLVKHLADARLVVTDQLLSGEEVTEVVHEALIRNWDRLRNWLISDRDFRSWQERLRVAIHEWQAAGHDEGSLLRGASLAVAEGWLEKRVNDLAEAERAYIELSLKLREREKQERETRNQRELKHAQKLAQTQRQRAMVLASGLVIAVFLIVLSTWLYTQSQSYLKDAQDRGTQSAASASTAEADRIHANTQARVSLARLIANETKTVYGEEHYKYIVELLLAVQSMRLFPTTEAAQVLIQNRLARSVAHVTQDISVNSVTFSPDRRYIVSGGCDRQNESYDCTQGSARVWEIISGKVIARMVHSGSVTTVAISPDGRYVASGSSDGTARVWEATNGHEIARMVHDKGVNAIAFSPNGQHVVSISYDGTSRVWEAASGKEISRMTQAGSVFSVAFSPNGRYVVSGGSYYAVVWEATSGREISRMSYEDAVFSVAFSPDGRYVVTGGCDIKASLHCFQASARVWEAANGKESARFTHNGWIMFVAFSPDGKDVISGSIDGTVKVWEATSGREVAQMIGSVTAMAISPDGRYVVFGGDDKIVRFYDVTSGNEIVRMIHDGAVTSVAFSSDGRFVVSGSYDGTARVWEINGDDKVASKSGAWARSVTFSPNNRYAVSVENRIAQIWAVDDWHEIAHLSLDEDWSSSTSFIYFSPDSRYVISVSEDKISRLWEEGGKVEAIKITQGAQIYHAAFSPDGRYIVSLGADETIRVWEATSGQEVAHMTHPKVSIVAFNPDSRLVGSAGYDNTVRIWDAASGKEMSHMTHDRPVQSVAFSSDGRYIVSGGSDGTARVWDPISGKEIVRLIHNDWVGAVAFSPDGLYVVTGGSGPARVWNMASGQEVARLPHNIGEDSVAFSPDGRYVVTGGCELIERAACSLGTTKVWEANSGREIARMPHDGYVRAVSFSPNGKYVISDSIGVQVWLWQPDDLIAKACSRLPRNLTRTEWAQYIGDALPYEAVCPNQPIDQETTSTP